MHSNSIAAKLEHAQQQQQHCSKPLMSLLSFTPIGLFVYPLL
jgi:hypothetical protein